MRSVRVPILVGLILAMAGMVGTLSGVTGAQESTPAIKDQETGTVELLDGYVAALNAHDGQEVAGYYAEDAVVTQAVYEGNTFTGRDEIARWIGDNVAGLPDLDVSVVSVTGADDRLVWEWVYWGAYTGQFPGAPAGEGQTVELRGVSVMELEDGEIVRETLYYDNLSFLTQIGVMGAATPAAN